MKKRVLFVDDEPAILAGLRLRLRSMRSEWDMEFVESGAAALEKLDEAEFDVIVTDMRMPKMDGARLLEIVQEHHPKVVRIVLSGHAELEAAMRAVPVSHQFLAKPCEAEVLVSVVKRACNLQQLVTDEIVRQAVGRVAKLPTVPVVYAKLRSLVASGLANAQDVAAVVKQDPGISARVLQLVNSAFFRLSREIGSVEQAIVYLGFDALQRIVLAAELFSIGKGTSEKATLALRELQKHSLAVANVAVALTSGGEEETYFTAALLHDVGKLLMTLHLPDHLDPIHEKMRSSGEPMHEVETQLFGVTHAEIGGYLLGVWGLPYGIVEAVANHHAPSRVGFAEPGLVSAVHLADALVHAITEDQAIVPDPTTVALYGPDDIWSDWLEQFRGMVLATHSGLKEPI